MRSDKSRDPGFYAAVLSAIGALIAIVAALRSNGRKMLPVQPPTVALALPRGHVPAPGLASHRASAHPGNGAPGAGVPLEAARGPNGVRQAHIGAQTLRESRDYAQVPGPHPAPVAPGGIPRAFAVATPYAVARPHAPVAPAPGCFMLSFRHRPARGHTDREACSQHANMIQLAETAKIASACVRVDGIPVHHRLEGTRIVLGPVAGPESVITVRYCTVGATCALTRPENCRVPRDSFLAALGVEESRDRDSQGSWGAGPGEADPDVTEISGSGHSLDPALQADEMVERPELAMFSLWDPNKRTAACGHPARAGT